MSVLTSVLGVFEEIGSWIVEFIPTLLTMFYVPETGLTFMGVLAVVGVGIGVILLLLNIVQGFLHFRG